MSNKKFQTIIDCGFSKIRAGAFNEEGKINPFFIESNFYTDQFNFKLDIQKIIASLEKSTNEYIDNIDLMIDSSKTISVAISVFKKNIEKSMFSFSSLKELSFFPSGRWDILTDKEILIKLPQKHIVASLNLSKRLINDDNFKDYKFIDLRIKNHLVAK